jgi:hypothetical protein
VRVQGGVWRARARDASSVFPPPWSRGGRCADAPPPPRLRPCPNTPHAQARCCPARRPRAATARSTTSTRLAAR